MVSSIERLKAYVAPSLIAGFCVVIWSLISEIRSDVKALLRADAQTQIRVDNLEKKIVFFETEASEHGIFAIKPKEIETPKSPYQKRN